jgi:ABC-2 type transport system ATP-binding protein
MDVVETVCDRVIVMSDGQIVADDTVAELLRNDDAHVLRLTSSDFDAELNEQLQDRFPVTAVQSREPGARIEVRTDSEGIYELMAWLRERDVALERVRTAEPDLEEVFVDLTAGDDR